VFSIEIDDTGELVACREGESVLLALVRNGCRTLPVGCRGGGCGVCKVAIIDGEFQAGKMSREHVSIEDQARGVVLACRTYARSDIRLKVLNRVPAQSINRWFG